MTSNYVYAVLCGLIGTPAMTLMTMFVAPMGVHMDISKNLADNHGGSEGRRDGSPRYCFPRSLWLYTRCCTGIP